MWTKAAAAAARYCHTYIKTTTKCKKKATRNAWPKIVHSDVSKNWKRKKKLGETGYWLTINVTAILICMYVYQNGRLNSICQEECPRVEQSRATHYRELICLLHVCLFVFVFQSTLHTSIKNHHHYLNKIEQVVASTARKEEAKEVVFESYIISHTAVFSSFMCACLFT